MKELLTITMGFEPLDDEVEYFYKIAAKENLDYEKAWDILINFKNFSHFFMV